MLEMSEVYCERRNLHKCTLQHTLNYPGWEETWTIRKQSKYRIFLCEPSCTLHHKFLTFVL